jgi:hypothetical protein
VLSVDGRAFAFPCELKLRFVQQVGGEYVLGAPIARFSVGESTRTNNGLVVLRRQAAIHRRRRESEIRKFLGREPGRNETCPFGTALKYKYCCGR